MNEKKPDPTEKKAEPGAAKAEAVKNAASAVSGTAPRATEVPSEFDKNKAADELETTREATKLRTREESVRNREAIREEPTKANANTTRENEQEMFITGFEFDMYELKNLYANMRDGNYYSAMRESVNILHKNFNPPVAVGRRAAMQATPQVRVAEVEEVIEKLEEHCEHIYQEATLHKQRTGRAAAPVNASQEKGIEKVTAEGVIAMVRLIIQLIQEWRNRRGV